MEQELISFKKKIAARFAAKEIADEFEFPRLKPETNSNFND